MASLIISTQRFVAPCHAHLDICHSKGPFPITRRLSIVNHKKKNPFSLKSLRDHILNDSIYDNFSPANDVEKEVSYSESMRFKNSARSNPVEERILQPASIPSNLQSYQRFIQGILKMSRLQNLGPSIVIVLVGGWLGGGRRIDVLLRPGQVWIAVICSALINVASMLVNDVFDFYSGTDQANGKTSPLLRGQIHPYHVELVALCLYGASIIGLCYLEVRVLRLLIGVVIIATYIYTPILKNLTMVKNMAISGIISSSILVGALAAGGEGQLQNPIITIVCLFTFLCFLSRELLMDVGDMVGDKVAGVNTLAVCFGGQIGTLTASICLVSANVLLITWLATKAQAFAIIGTLILLPLHAKMLSLWKFLEATKDAFFVNFIHEVVQQSMVHIGFGVLILAYVA